MKYNKVLTNGQEWLVTGKNERGTSVGNRHFYARRGLRKKTWTIIEHDQSLVLHGTAMPLFVYANNYETAELTDAVKRIALAIPGYEDIDPRVSYEAYQARFSATNLSQP